MAYRVELLGSLRVLRDGAELPRLTSQKAATLLALLALSPSEPLPRGQLVLALWPEAASEAGRNNLSVTLHSLRKAFPDLLQADQQSVSLQAETDLQDLEAAFRENRFTEVVELFRGELAPGLAAPALEQASTELHSKAIHAIEHEVRRLREERKLREAIALDCRLLGFDPFNAKAHRRLIRLHLEDGNRRAAQEAYDAYARMLKANFGTEPEFVLPGPTSEAATQAAPRASFAGRSKVPVRLSKFFGRQQELDLIDQVRQTRNLITITGLGGVGKTRLAQQAIARVEATGDAWVAYIELADAKDTISLAATMAQALGHGSAGAPLEAIVQGAPVGPGVVVLDNLERAVHQDADELVQWVYALVDALPEVVWLCTSRVPLGIDGECELHLNTLPAPRGRSVDEISANARIQLFVNRAQNVDPSFSLTEDNADDVVDICNWLDGVPIAIELAAAGVRRFTPKAMIRRLGARLNLPEGKHRDAATRHKTIRAVLSESLDMLSPEERAAFLGCSVFSGGFTSESACQVLGDVESLTGLVKASLIESTETEQGLRYHMLALVREFSESEAETEIDVADLRRRHADHFLSFALEWREGLRGEKQPEALISLKSEHENLLAGLDYALEAGIVGCALHYVSGLWRFWNIVGLLDFGRKRLERALELAGDSVEPESEPALADALNVAGNMAYSAGDYASALRNHEKSLAIRRRIGDPFAIAASLNNLGLNHMRLDEVQKARAGCEEGLQIMAQASGDRRELTTLLTGTLALIELKANQPEEAAAKLQSVIDHFTELGNLHAVANNKRHLSRAYWMMGRKDKAKSNLSDSLEMARELQARPLELSILTQIALFAAESGQVVEAATLAAAVAQERRDLTISLVAGDSYDLEILQRLLVGTRGSRLGSADLRGFADKLLEEL